MICFFNLYLLFIIELLLNKSLKTFYIAVLHHLNSSGIKSLFHDCREFCWQRIFNSWHHLWLLPGWKEHTRPRSRSLFGLVLIQYLINLANWCFNSENIDSSYQLYNAPYIHLRLSSVLYCFQFPAQTFISSHL